MTVIRGSIRSFLCLKVDIFLDITFVENLILPNLYVNAYIKKMHFLIKLCMAKGHKRLHKVTFKFRNKLFLIYRFNLRFNIIKTLNEC